GWLIRELRWRSASEPPGTCWRTRYRRFLWTAASVLLGLAGQEEAPFLFFWPGGATWAAVLTHDVETLEGQRFVAEVADREERLGFRSSLNFVAEGYPLDAGLLEGLAARRFEVGVHGLRHDGR